MAGLTKGATEKPDQHRTRSWWCRPRVRLSVRALMMLVLVLGGGLGWVVHRARVQRDAIALIEKEGGGFIFDDQVDAEGLNRPLSERIRPTWQQWIMYAIGDDYVRRARYLAFPSPSKALDEETWRAIMSLDDLVVLRLGEVIPDDAHLVALLRRFPNLRCLDIRGSRRVTDVGLAPLRGLHRLRLLNLSFTGIDDAGMAHIEGLSRLQSLELAATRVTDSGLARLRGLNELISLDLGVTQVGDAGLAHLRSLPQIKDLSLRRLATIMCPLRLSPDNIIVTDCQLSPRSLRIKNWRTAWTLRACFSGASSPGRTI